MADQRLNIIFSGDGSLLSKTINELESDLKGFEQELKKTNTTDAFKGISGKIAETTQRINQLKGASQGFSNSFKSITTGSNTATFALTNLGRVAQDLPFGFIGIANNLNPLLESFQRLRLEAGSNAGALKLLGKSLTGAGGIGVALSAVSAILTISQLGFSAWTRGFGDASKEAGEAARKIKSAFDVIGDATDSVQGDIANVNALANAFANTDSLEKQKRILDELKKTNENYFGELKAGVSTVNDITNATNAYSQALIQQAIVKGLQEEISELAKQIRVATKEYNDLTAKTTAAGKSVDNYSVKAVRGEQAADQQASSVNDLSSSYKKLSGRLQESASKLGGLRTQFNSLSDEIQKQVGISLNLKPLSGGDKGLKEATDDILARARQFVKEFGDVFVLPDLSDSFFTTEKELKTASRKLLGNVKKFIEGDVSALKLKIPVAVDFELLPTEFQLSQSTIDNFFKGVGQELKIPINVVPDITLEKSSVDKIKLLDDLRKQFSVLGKIGRDQFDKIDFGFKEGGGIDFTKMNAGLIEASKNLKGMLEIANTINQAIGQGLASAFDAAFDAVLEGKSVFKALGEAVKQLVVGTIKAVAQMLILKAVTSLIFPGGGGIAGALGGGLLGRGGVASPSFGGGVGGLRMAVEFTGQLTGRGSDLYGTVQQGQAQIGRVR